MKKYLTIALTLILVGCQAPEQTKVDVKVSGMLRSIMHEGKLAATVSIDTLNGNHLYGLGALDSLKGEVLMLDGVGFTSVVYEGGIITKPSKNTTASLFVYANVSKWDTIQISGFQEFTQVVSEEAKRIGLTEPFPFILIGSPDSLSYHVINYDPETSDITNHKEGAFIETLTGEPLTVLGFYSTKAKGIYTHHDSDVHLHFINEDASKMGHVDRVVARNGMFNLLLPKQ